MLKRIFTLLLLAFCLAPMVVEAATEYKIDEVSRKLYPRPEWYIKLTTEDGNWTFCYDILTDEIVPGRVYTIDDMLKSDCQAYDNWERVSHKFETATYCETYSDDGKLMIEATATTVDGMEILLHYGIDPLPDPIGTIDVTTSDVELEDLTSRGAAMFVGTTDEYVVSVGLKVRGTGIGGTGGEIPGEYKMDDLYESFCYIEPKGGDIIAILDGHATVVATERGYNVDAQFLGEDAYLYDIHFTYEVPEPLETRTLKCDNLVINSTYAAEFGEIIYEASNEDWELELWVNTDKPLGYFSGNIVDASYSVLTNRHTKEMFDLYYADFVVGTDEKNVYLRGGMLARDKNYYVLDLSAPLTVDTRTVTLDIANGLLFDNTENGVLQLYGTSEDGNTFVSLALKTYDPITAPATFDRSQTHRDYTYVEEYSPAPIFYEPYIATINLIPQADGSMNVEAYLRCDNLVNDEDHPLYIVRMHCSEDADAQLGLKFDAQSLDYEATISSEYVAIDDQFLDEGYVYLDGYDPESRASISLEFNLPLDESGQAILDPTIGIPAGTYPINTTWEPGTISASRGVIDGVVWPSYAAYGDANGSLDVPVWLLQSGSATVTNVDNHLYLELEGKNSCNRSVHIVFGERPVGIRPIPTEFTTKRRKILRDGQLLIKNTNADSEQLPSYRYYDTHGRRVSR